MIMRLCCLRFAKKYLLLITNLKYGTKHSVSGRTCKKKYVWVSELDVDVASRQLVCDIVDFQVHQTAHLPSGHAPVTLKMRLSRVNLSVLDKRARKLAGHNSPMKWAGWAEECVGRLVSELFTVGMPSTETLYDMNNVNSFNTNVTGSLYQRKVVVVMLGRRKTVV